jgi:CheY-like chemotaxis protein
MTTNRLVIIYADDDDLVRQAVTQGLIEEGIDVHACADGEEVLALRKQITPNVILLDLNMPTLDGLETARRLRRDPQNREMRLIAITGRGTWDLRQKAMEAGFDEFVVKPIPIVELAKILWPT